MNFKSYTFNIFLRVLLLAAVMMAFFYALNQEKWYVTTTVSGLMIPVFIVSLISYTHRFRREISNFLLAIQNREYSQYQKESFTSKAGELSHALEVIAKELQNVTIEKESHYHYLRAIVDNINTGIISYSEPGDVHLFNLAASNLLGILEIKNINALQKYNKTLHNAMLRIKPGERRLLNWQIEGKMVKIAMQAREFKQHGRLYKLISLQDIRSELEAQEVESYQKLIKVLRHEIMNSATPISSLSEAVKDSVEDLINTKNKSEKEIEEELNDLLISTKTIHTRTKGLLNFVQNYRKLTNIPKPNIETIDFQELLHHSLHLLRNEFEDKNIKIKTDVPEKSTIQGDFEQIEQVVINILLNSIHAVKNTEMANISIIYRNTNGEKVQVRFKDNGTGINKEDIENVFVPFYTTRKDGSGIGLSLAKQIMKLHQGDIRIYNNKTQGATCELQFNT